jgi:hypothetical protein
MKKAGKVPGLPVPVCIIEHMFFNVKREKEKDVGLLSTIRVMLNS